MNLSEEQAQEFFNTDFDVLKEMAEDDVEYIEQNHFGDLLVETYVEDNERLKLWRNLDENVAQGESLIEVEYHGKLNGYTWETVFTLDD